MLRLLSLYPMVHNMHRRPSVHVVNFWIEINTGCQRSLCDVITQTHKRGLTRRCHLTRLPEAAKPSRHNGWYPHCTRDRPLRHLPLHTGPTHTRHTKAGHRATGPTGPSHERRRGMLLLQVEGVVPRRLLLLLPRLLLPHEEHLRLHKT